MFLYSLMLQFGQRFVWLLLIAASMLMAQPRSIQASPGAHGPNGEHLDTSEKVAVSSNPKFESFTETFELVGELLQDQLVIYLHDFQSNTPIAGAEIELESGALSATAKYSPLLKAYAMTQQEMLQLLHTEGNHEIVLTIMSEDNGDLLVANLAQTKKQEALDVHENEEAHHHHFPWWAVILSTLAAVIVFVIGFRIGSVKKGVQS